MQSTFENEKKRRWTIDGASCAPILVLVVQSELLYDSLVGREPGTAAQPQWGSKTTVGGETGVARGDGGYGSKKEKSKGGTRKGGQGETNEKP